MDILALSNLRMPHVAFCFIVSHFPTLRLFPTFPNISPQLLQFHVTFQSFSSNFSIAADIVLNSHHVIHVINIHHLHPPSPYIFPFSSQIFPLSPYIFPFSSQIFTIFTYSPYISLFPTVDPPFDHRVAPPRAAPYPPWQSHRRPPAPFASAGLSPGRPPGRRRRGDWRLARFKQYYIYMYIYTYIYYIRCIIYTVYNVDILIY